MITKATTGQDQRRQREAEELLADLTERELEIATLVAQGLSNQEIADATFMALRTCGGSVVMDRWSWTAGWL